MADAFNNYHGIDVADKLFTPTAKQLLYFNSYNVAELQREADNFYRAFNAAKDKESIEGAYHD